MFFYQAGNERGWRSIYPAIGHTSEHRAQTEDVKWSRIVGWALADDLKTRLVLDALDMALCSRRPSSVIHPSDKG